MVVNVTPVIKGATSCLRKSTSMSGGRNSPLKSQRNQGAVRECFSATNVAAKAEMTGDKSNMSVRFPRLRAGGAVQFFFFALAGPILSTCLVESYSWR